MSSGVLWKKRPSLERESSDVDDYQDQHEILASGNRKTSKSFGGIFGKKTSSTDQSNQNTQNVEQSSQWYNSSTSDRKSSDIDDPKLKTESYTSDTVKSSRTFGGIFGKKTNSIERSEPSNQVTIENTTVDGVYSSSKPSGRQLFRETSSIDQSDPYTPVFVVGDTSRSSFKSNGNNTRGGLFSKNTSGSDSSKQTSQETQSKTTTSTSKWSFTRSGSSVDKTETSGSTNVTQTTSYETHQSYGSGTTANGSQGKSSTSSSSGFKMSFGRSGGPVPSSETANIQSPQSDSNALTGDLASGNMVSQTQKQTPKKDPKVIGRGISNLFQKKVNEIAAEQHLHNDSSDIDEESQKESNQNEGFGLLLLGRSGSKSSESAPSSGKVLGNTSNDAYSFMKDIKIDELNNEPKKGFSSIFGRSGSASTSNKGNNDTIKMEGSSVSSQVISSKPSDSKNVQGTRVSFVEESPIQATKVENKKSFGSIFGRLGSNSNTSKETQDETNKGSGSIHGRLGSDVSSTNQQEELAASLVELSDREPGSMKISGKSNYVDIENTIQPTYKEQKKGFSSIFGRGSSSSVNSKKIDESTTLHQESNTLESSSMKISGNMEPLDIDDVSQGTGSISKKGFGSIFGRVGSTSSKTTIDNTKFDKSTPSVKAINTSPSGSDETFVKEGSIQSTPKETKKSFGNIFGRTSSTSSSTKGTNDIAKMDAAADIAKDVKHSDAQISGNTGIGYSTNSKNITENKDFEKIDGDVQGNTNASKKSFGSIFGRAGSNSNTTKITTEKTKTDTIKFSEDANSASTDIKTKATTVETKKGFGNIFGRTGSATITTKKTENDVKIDEAENLAQGGKAVEVASSKGSKISVGLKSGNVNSADNDSSNRGTSSISKKGFGSIFGRTATATSSEKKIDETETLAQENKPAVESSLNKNRKSFGITTGSKNASENVESTSKESSNLGTSGISKKSFGSIFGRTGSATTSAKATDENIKIDQAETSVQKSTASIDGTTSVSKKGFGSIFGKTGSTTTSIKLNDKNAKTTEGESLVQESKPSLDVSTKSNKTSFGIRTDSKNLFGRTGSTSSNNETTIETAKVEEAKILNQESKTSSISNTSKKSFGISIGRTNQKKAKLEEPNLSSTSVSEIKTQASLKVDGAAEGNIANSTSKPTKKGLNFNFSRPNQTSKTVKMEEHKTTIEGEEVELKEEAKQAETNSTKKGFSFNIGKSGGLNMSDKTKTTDGSLTAPKRNSSIFGQSTKKDTNLSAEDGTGATILADSSGSTSTSAKSSSNIFGRSFRIKTISNKHEANGETKEHNSESKTGEHHGITFPKNEGFKVASENVKEESHVQGTKSSTKKNFDIKEWFDKVFNKKDTKKAPESSQ